MIDSVDARILSESVGIFQIRQEADMHRLLDAYVKVCGKTPEDAMQHMIARWNEYQTLMPALQWSYGSSYKFFMSGNWDNPDTWPRKEKSRAEKIAEWRAPDDDEAA